MKPRAWSIRCIVILAVSLWATHANGATAGDSKKGTAGAAKAAPADAAKKKEEPMGKVDGIEVKRGDGSFGVAIVEGHFQIKFYDAKRKVVPAPVTRIVLRWPVNYRPADERTVVEVSADGKSLTGGKIVKAPYVFKLFITFLADGADDAGGGTETYTIDFHA